MQKGKGDIIIAGHGISRAATNSVVIYLFAFFFLAQFGRNYYNPLNQVILWVGGPLMVAYIVFPRLSASHHWPREYWLYGTLILFSLAGYFNIIDWGAFMRYFQVIASNLLLMLMVYIGINTWNDFIKACFVIWLSCLLIVLISITFEASVIDPGTTERLGGLAQNANGLANYCRVGIILSLFLLLTSKNIIWRSIYLGSLLIFSYTILITASRTNFALMAVIITAVLMYNFLKGWKLIIILVFMLAFGTTIYNYLEQGLSNFYLYDRLTSNESVGQLQENEARIILYGLAFEQFINNPVLGVGLNQFRIYSGGRISHSDVLDIGVQLGVFAMACYMAIYIILFRRILSTRKLLRKFRMDYLFMLLVLFFFTEVSFGVTNPNWFSQLQMVSLSLMIVLVKKVIPHELNYIENIRKDK